METKEEKQKKFVTEFEINGEKYGGYIMLQLFPKLKILLDKEKRQRKL